MQKLSVKALGLAFGIFWAICIFLLGILGMFGFGTTFIDLISRVYLGYKISVIGAIIGAIWGFIDAFVCGAILAWFYNKFVK